MYVNRHDKPSLTLQGICDANRKFIDCFTGTSSRIHDSRVFQLSFIYPIVHKMGDHYHLLGDGAYSVATNLLTPYRIYNNVLNPVKQNFNDCLASPRVKIENAFGLLKGRFRQLDRIDFHTVLKDSKFIICCCVLHNLCMECDDFLSGLDDNLGAHIDETNDPFVVSKPDGERKRDNIANDLI